VGKGSLEKIDIATSKNSAEIYLLGAHLTSFATNGGEFIFVSDKAIFQIGKAIRGGVPICWPQFASNGDLPQHGFARNRLWKVQDISSGNDEKGEYASASLILEDDEDTRKIWPHSFSLIAQFVIREDDSIEQTLSATNKNSDGKAFTFTTALHSYFNVSDISKASVEGLKGCEYADKVVGGVKKEESGAISFDKETDKIYYGAPSEIKIVDSGKSTIRIQSKGFPECVVWNPWIEKAKSTADLDDDDYHKFVCAESALVRDPVTLQPGQVWTASHLISRL